MDKQNFYGISGFSNEEARKYISLLFDGYEMRKKEKRLYVHDGVPEIIIKTYYSFVEKQCFDQIVYNFKRRYIYNESKLEQVHSKEEKDGLACVYNYIQTKTDLENINIYDLSYIHEALYSKTPFPEFGGKYRQREIYLLGNSQNGLNTGSVELCPYWDITHEMNALKPVVDELVKRGIKLGENIDVNNLIDYINDCVKLKCKIIKIHPFEDGNGRATRAFINLLFRLANIPPIYVENKEKEKYQKAMNNALVKDDFSDIINFYYFKICDSIMALDISIKKDLSYEDADLNAQKKEK